MKKAGPIELCLYLIQLVLSLMVVVEKFSNAWFCALKC